MNRYSINAMSRAIVAAVLFATAALSGCASLSDESFIWAGNDTTPHDRMEGA